MMMINFFSLFPLRNGGANPPVVASMLTTGTPPDDERGRILFLERAER